MLRFDRPRVPVYDADGYASPSWNLSIKGDVGERGRNRTYNLLIKSQLLCQLSYAPACLITAVCKDFALTGFCYVPTLCPDAAAGLARSLRLIPSSISACPW